jgi:hypothetical protein
MYTLNTTSTKIETIAAASIIMENMEFVGCGGSTGGFATGAFETWGTGLVDGELDDTDSWDLEADSPLLVNEAPEVAS